MNTNDKQVDVVIETKTIKLNKLAPTKEEEQEKFKKAIEQQFTPYYDVLNRCTKAIIKELDSEATTIETKQVREAVNFVSSYATLIHSIVASPQLQEAVIDFIIQIEETKPETKSKS